MSIRSISILSILVLFLTFFIFTKASFASPFEYIEKLVIKGRIFLTTRGISYIEKQILKSAKFRKVNGKIVAQRNIFDPYQRDALGRTNIERMKQGLAPIGYDGKPVELHHLKQEEDGIIVEMLSSEHKKFYKELHRYKQNSEINRMEFNKWRVNYWKERAKEFEK